MKEKMIIISPAGEIKAVDYESFESVHKAIGDKVFFFKSVCIPVIPTLASGEYFISTDFICGNSKTEQINPFGVFISGKTIRGNIAIIASKRNGVNRGFYYKEENINGTDISEFYLHQSVKNFINSNKQEMKILSTASKASFFLKGSTTH